MDNLLLDTDGYKFSHNKQYPEDVTQISSYIEARGVQGFDWKEHVFVGLQPFLKRIGAGITKYDLEEAIDFSNKYQVAIDVDLFKNIIENHDGYFPLHIESLDEGSVVPLGTPLVQVWNTDHKSRGLGGFLETAMLRAVWYPSTVATQSFHAKRVIKKYLLETGGSLAGIDFMLHDFGARGVSSKESAAIGGAAHLMVFQGSDTLSGIEHLFEHYNPSGFPGFSVPAAEHSTITSWGKDHEVDAYRNMLKLYAKPNAIISVVSDSYDIYNAVQHLWGGVLQQEVIALGDIGARLVIRPDSGDPIATPIKVVQLLMQRFGFTTTETGHKLLPQYVRVLQGDGINLNSLELILNTAKLAGLCAENFVFGMGGGLLQQVNRDTLKFAMKANAVKSKVGAWRDVYKNPVGGGKTSKRGRQVVFHANVDGEEKRFCSTEMMDYLRVGTDVSGNLLQSRFNGETGELYKETNLDEIRQRINLAL